MLQRVPTLAEIVAQPARAKDLPSDAVPELLGQLEAARAALWRRMTMTVAPSGQAETAHDRLLTVEEAAARLGLSADYLYRNKSLSFRVAVGARGVRFSEKGIDQWLRNRPKGGGEKT